MRWKMHPTHLLNWLKQNYRKHGKELEHTQIFARRSFVIDGVAIHWGRYRFDCAY